jgi:hypothetical protein
MICWESELGFHKRNSKEIKTQYTSKKIKIIGKTYIMKERTESLIIVSWNQCRLCGFSF